MGSAGRLIYLAGLVAGLSWLLPGAHRTHKLCLRGSRDGGLTNAA